MSRNLTNTIICWEPGGEVALLSYPGKKAFLDRLGLSMSWGACNFYLHDLPFKVRKCEVFIKAMHLIVRDGCKPDTVHHALLGLEEYRDGCSDDMPGINRKE